jgi:hypothetical protein
MIQLSISRARKQQRMARGWYFAGGIFLLTRGSLLYIALPTFPVVKQIVSVAVVIVIATLLATAGYIQW